MNWIKCSELMPEIDDEVLFWSPENKVEIGYWFIEGHKRGFLVSDPWEETGRYWMSVRSERIFELKDVQFWQHLPIEPSEENDNIATPCPLYESDNCKCHLRGF